MATIKAGDLHIGYKKTRHDADKEATGEAVVFLHGVGSDKSAWDFQIEYFSQARRAAVALDYPGYGESDVPAHNLNREQVAHYVLSALEELDIRRMKSDSPATIECGRRFFDNLPSLFHHRTFSNQQKALDGLRSCCFK